MNDSKFAQQLINDLPSLVSRNVIDAGGAEALRRHYEPQIKPSRAASIGLTISAILGGLLVGAGIILLIAHNWDDLSRPARAVLVLLPLLACAGLAGYTILRKMDSAAWREGCGAFYVLSVGASIALVSQTYHLYNDMAGFLFAWSLLSLPVIYLLNSGAAFAGFLACVVAYTLVVNDGWWGVVHLRMRLLLFVATLPFYVWHVWKRRESLMVAWLSWALAAAVLIMVATIFEYSVNFVSALLCYGLLFTVYYLASCCWFGGLRGWRAPFRSIGALGIAAVSVMLTFSEAYWHWSWDDGWNRSPNRMTFLAVAYLAWLLLAVFAVRRKKYFNWAAACFPVVIAYILPGGGSPLLMIAYVLALGVFTLVSGIKRDSLLSMNEGAVLIAALVVCRFFDDDYGFVVRGVAFIVIGCGFLVMNWVVMRKRNKQKHKGGAA